MIAETLAGIALCKSAIDAVRKGLETAKDASALASELDRFFTGEQQVNAAANKKAGADNFSIKSVAQETVNRRLAAEQRQELGTMLDLRFGPGTMASIVNERARLIQDHKEAQKKARIEKNRQQHEMMQTFKQVMLAVMLIVFALGCFVVLFMFA